MDNDPGSLKSQSITTRIARDQSAEYRKFAAKHDVLVHYLVAILSDCKMLLPSYSCVEFERDKETILTRFSHEGLSFATKTLPSFFDSLLNYLETGISVYPSFKLRNGRPVFLRRLTKQIYEKPNDVDTVIYMKCLYQLCVAFKKLKGPYKPSVIHDQLVNFVKVDWNLPQFVDPDEKIDKIIDGAEQLIGQVLKGLNPFDRSQAHLFSPRPGPGATNSPTEAHERYRPHTRYTSLQKEFPLEEWYQPLSRHPQFHRWDLRVGKICKYSLKEVLAPTARFKTVHKTFGKPRGICIEELETQWLQQGVRNAMYDRIEAHPLTSGFVNFRDQSINAVLAVQSSLDRKYSTIDMSEGSDRIARELVRRTHKSNKHLLRALMTLSTRVIQMPHAEGIPRFMRCRKYAPMGSALCFPVMGLVHWALIKSLIHLELGPHVDVPVWVYGDDIIVKSEHTELVYETLPLFGMKINKEKSYYKSAFRESCGAHAYMGANITPTRFKSVVKFPPVNEDLVSALHYEGELFEKGFLITASLIRQSIQHFRAFGAKHLPKVGKKSPLLGWIRERGDALSSLSVRERWNDGHSLLLKNVRVLEPRLSTSLLLPYVEGYLRSLITKQEDAGTMGGSPAGLQIRRKWLPDSDLVEKSEVRTRVLALFNLQN